MTDEDKQHDLFKILDAIQARVFEIEKILVGPCGRWQWDYAPFLVERFGGKWRVMDTSDPVCHKPVVEAPIERRIAFAKLSKQFVAAYVEWKTTRLEDLRKQAQEALGEMI